MTPPLGEEPARSLTGPPPRPPRMSDSRSPFDEPPPPAPASVVASMWFWLASALVPVLGLVYAVTRFSDISAHLKQAARDADPAASAEAISRAAAVTAGVALLALAVPVILQIVLALLMVGRRSWARVALVIVAVIGLPAAAIAFGALSDDDLSTQNKAEMAIGIQAVLVLLAVVLMFLPTANRWLRRRGR